MQTGVRIIASDDPGFTLTEMLVAMLIFAIVVAIVSLTLSTFETGLANQRASNTAMQNTEIAAESFTQFLRSSQQVVMATADEVQFVADVGYDAATNTVDTTTVDAAIVTSQENGRPANLLRIRIGSNETFIGEVMLDGANSPFTYCAYAPDASLSASSDPDCPPPSGSSDDPLTVLAPGSSGLDASQLAEISIVHVDFSFVGAVGSTGAAQLGLPVTYDTQVSLQNEIPSSIAA